MLNSFQHFVVLKSEGTKEERNLAHPGQFNR